MSSNGSEIENIGLPQRSRRSRVTRAVQRAGALVRPKDRATQIISQASHIARGALQWGLDRQKAERVQTGMTWIANRALAASFKTDPTAKVIFELMVAAEEAQPDALRSILTSAQRTQVKTAKVVEALLFRDDEEEQRDCFHDARRSFEDMLRDLGRLSAQDDAIERVWAAASEGAGFGSGLVQAPAVDLKHPAVKVMSLSLTLAFNAFVSRVAIEALPDAVESLARFVE